MLTSSLTAPQVRAVGLVGGRQIEATAEPRRDSIRGHMVFVMGAAVP